jgi:hypothetical protein
MGKQVGQASMCSMGPALDCADGHTKAGSSFFVGKAQEEGRLDNSALFGRQLVNRISNFPRLPHPLKGGWQGDDVWLVNPVDPVAALPAIHVNGGPPGNRVQPGCRISLQIEGTGSSPGLQEGLLGCVLGEGAIAQGP